MKTLSHRDAWLTLQLVPLVAGVRWRLWRTPFSRLHGQWRHLVQSEMDKAALSPISSISTVAATTSTSPTREQSALAAEVWRCAHAVRRAARLVPRGSCLTQAMALQLVLARRGQPCRVHIGVDRKPASPLDALASARSVASSALPDQGRFEAHAWVEWQGRVILGGDISRWKPLTIFAPATATPKAANCETVAEDSSCL